MEDKFEERVITVPVTSKLKEWLNALVRKMMTKVPSLSKLTERFRAFVLKIKLSFKEGKQFSAWLKEKKRPEDIFKLLRLDTGTKNLMANSNLQTWSVYMTLYNKDNPTKMTTMLGMLTKTYGDLKVANMLEAARRNRKTFNLADMLQGQQLRGWARNGLSTDIVFDLLKVGEGGVENLFVNPAFTVWFYYFTRMNRYNPDSEIDMFKKLLANYDEISLAKAIEAATKAKSTERLVKSVWSTEFVANAFRTAQYKYWQAENIGPPTIFSRLGMGKTKWELDPKAEIFRGYKTFYDANKSVPMI
ncbi:hypothetical protein PI124_g8011 [Phytophthora idaei]|nr:hypothetical protein PI125_g5546 [Phytophthora idaei]KAG3146754.1 hypothetical protein PI126_g13186 [Phytophthora idaei]KAG3247263.1 hypothetical protein PI124_g8011 [Phytophthora idaei]